MSEQTSFSSDPVDFETPVAKHKIVLKGYVTARMQLATRGVFLGHTKINMKGMQGKSEAEIKNMKEDELTRFDDEIPASVINEINEITLRHMIISIDGQKGTQQEMLDTVLEMPPEDYEAIIEKCNDISKSTSLSDTKKK